MNADTLRQRQDAAWRDPAQVVSGWEGAARIEPRVLESRTTGSWWDLMRALKVTLLVTREYEHVVVAISADRHQRRLSYFPLPHPSGIAIDRVRSAVHVASTRNPNQLVIFEPAGRPLRRADVPSPEPDGTPLLPLRTTFFPGSLYLHDLAVFGGTLHATATGQNAVVRLRPDGRHEPVWWPRCVETARGALFDRNVIQLNSIAAGPTLEASYFTASADRVSVRRPGHRNFAVDGRGVVFSGRTRETMVRGLTRPHSARLDAGRIWVANSGYGELGVCVSGVFEPIVRLPGWVRGLCLVGGIAFVGTSRVIPRFSRYAPGLQAGRAVCGVHAVEIASGRVLGAITWPYGNQIFACDWLARDAADGFPFPAGRRRSADRTRRLFYAFSTRSTDRGRRNGR